MLESTVLHSTNYKKHKLHHASEQFLLRTKEQKNKFKIILFRITFLIELDQVTIEKEIFTKENKSHRPNFSINFVIIKLLMDKF